jgi:hypothetical protein
LLLHLPANGRPSLTGFNLSDADQQQGQPAEQNMRTDAIILGMIDRAQIEGALERPEGILYLEQFIAQCYIFGGQMQIAGG